MEGAGVATIQLKVNRMSSFANRNFLVGYIIFITVGAVLPATSQGQQDLDYETIRFYTKNSKPEQVAAYAFSPDGRYLALSFNRRNLGATSGASIVDLEKKELVGQTGSFSFFTLAFSSDSRHVAGIGNYAGFQVIDVQRLSNQKRNVPDVVGKIGISLEEKNGKLLITKVNSASNPTIGDQLRVGDEVLAINAGEKPTRYDDSREWQMIAGKTLKKALEIMEGKPGTWVQLRLSRYDADGRLYIATRSETTRTTRNLTKWETFCGPFAAREGARIRGRSP